MIKSLNKIFVFILLSNLAHAQKPTDSISYKTRLTKIPILSLDYFNYSKSNLETDFGSQKIGMNEFRVELRYFAVLKKDKIILVNGINYSNFTFNIEKANFITELSEDFHSLSYNLGLIKILPKRWKLFMSIVPTLATDFGESLTTEDFILQASILATKRSTPFFEYGFGLAYTSSFGVPLPIPLFRLSRKKNNWKTSAVLPVYALQAYSFSDNTQLGIKLSISGNLYNSYLDSSTTSLDLNKVSYSRILVGPEFRQKLLGDFYLNLTSGLVFRNILEFQDNNSNVEIDFDVKEKFFLNVGLKFLK